MKLSSKWKRRLIWTGTSVVAAVVYLWFFGVQTFFALETRNIGRKVPIVNSVPIELSDHSVSDARGTRLSFRGVEFEFPWNDIDGERTRLIGNWAVIAFQSSKSIILCVNPPKSFITDMSKDQTVDPQLFSMLYGREVLNSDYTVKKAIFETTPSQINLFTPENRAIGLSMVILIKAIMPPTTDWQIYKVSSGDLQGFQLGDPVRRPKKICVELFGKDIEFEINITQMADGPTPAITQQELNRIIQTAHRTADEQQMIKIFPLQ